MALNSTMNISIAVIQNLFLLFPQESIFFLKNISRLKGLLYPCLLSPTPSRAELYFSVRDPNLILHKLFLFQTLEMDPKRRGTPAYNRSYDSEYQWPRKFQRTNPYNQDQVNLCDVEKTL